MDISKFVTIGEDGKAKIDTSAFQSEFDSEVSRAVEKNKTKVVAELTSKIKKELEEEAKLSAEEKLKKDREAFEAQKADFEALIAKSKADIAREKAKSKIPTDVFDDETVGQLLSIVNSEEDIPKIEKFVASMNKKIETAKQEVVQQYTAGTPSPQNGGADGESYAAKFAKNANSGTKTGGVTAFTNNN